MFTLFICEWFPVLTLFLMNLYLRDEDDEMKKFIETEMGKIKGKDLEVDKESEGSKYLSPEDAALQVCSTFFLALRV